MASYDVKITIERNGLYQDEDVESVTKSQRVGRLDDPAIESRLRRTISAAEMLHGPEPRVEDSGSPNVLRRS